MSTKYVQAPVLYLAGSGVIVGATSIVLTSLTDIYGNVLTMTDFGDKGYITLEPDTSNEEAASFTGITANSNGTYTLTGVKTGLAKSPYTETSGLIRAHAGGTKVVITDTVQHIDNFVNKNNDATIAGTMTFTANPVVPSPVGGTDAANKNYVLSVVSGGTVTTNSIIENGTAGETVSAGQVLYLKSTDGRWWKADASTAATVDSVQLGIAQGAGTAGNSITGGILRRGVDINQSGGSAGALGYIRNSGGTVNTSAGTTTRIIGNFLSATNFDFDPAYYYTLTANQKNALIDGGSFRFGGTGADGALSISSGTTTINLSGSQYYILNYTSISITGTGKLAFSNPHANGTTVIIKSQGNVTLTSSTVPNIDASSIGAAGGASYVGTSGDGNDGSNGITFSIFQTNKGKAGNLSAPSVSDTPTAILPTSLSLSQSIISQKYNNIFIGSGGGSGRNGSTLPSTSGAGGRGGGCLIIECNGYLNFTTAGGISVSGGNGSAGSLAGTGNSGGGGGGSGGFCAVFYNSLTASSGTINSSGGTGGTEIYSGPGGNSFSGGGGASATNTSGAIISTTGGAGGDGLSIIAKNTDFA